MRATITKPGVNEPGSIPGSVRRSEPYARLEDGRTMPMGLNMGKTYPVGTTGTAKYVKSASYGLWHFTPDEQN